MESTVVEQRPASQVSPKSGWDRPTWHFFVDVLLLISLLGLVWTSAILQLVFPPPTTADGWSLWGWGYDTWSIARFAALCVFLLIVLIHVMLQWNWVCNYLSSRVSKARGEKVIIPKAVRTLYGVGTMIVILTLICILLAAAEFAVKAP